MTSIMNRQSMVLCSFLAGFLFMTPAFAVKRLVGATRTYKTPSAVAAIVNDGDTVEIDTGAYTDTATWRANNLTLRGKSTYAHLSAPAVIWNKKAIWVIRGNNTVIENIEFSGAAVPDSNGAGIRQEGDNLVVRGCFFHDNENGILGGGTSASTVLIEKSEFANNGFGDGYSHNMYISHIASFTLQFCFTHHAKIGHLIKTRAEKNAILYNRIMDETDGTASYEIDIPNGGTSYIIGNVIQQGMHTDNPTIVSYGAEGITNPGKDLYLINNTIVNDRSNGTFISVASSASRARITNNLFVGSGTLISGPADTLTNITTSSPAFISRSAFDYRPTSSTPGINKGSSPGSADAYILLPAYQYAYDCKGEARNATGQIDVGAFEYSASSTLQKHFTPYTAQWRQSARTGSQYSLSGRMFNPRAFSTTLRTRPAFIANTIMR